MPSAAPALARAGSRPSPGARPRWSEQKHVCYHCPLYTEHQEYKFRYFNWLSFPITATVVALVFHLFDSGYSFAAQHVGKVLNSSAAVPDATTAAQHSPFEWIVLGILTLLLWSYIVSLIDKVFLKWKL